MKFKTKVTVPPLSKKNLCILSVPPRPRNCYRLLPTANKLSREESWNSKRSNWDISPYRRFFFLLVDFFVDDFFLVVPESSLVRRVLRRLERFFLRGSSSTSSSYSPRSR